MSGPVPASPTPWRLEDDTTLIWGACSPDDCSAYGMGYPVAECRVTPSGTWAPGPWADEGKANAAAIVHRMNNWDAVVGALEAAEEHFGPFTEITINGEHDPEDMRVIGLIRAALALAKGEAQ